MIANPAPIGFKAYFHLVWDAGATESPTYRAF